MFNQERLDKLAGSLEETISLLKALLEQNRKQNEAWKILSDRVLKLDDPQRAAFGTARPR